MKTQSTPVDNPVDDTARTGGRAVDHLAVIPRAPRDGRQAVHRWGQRRHNNFHDDLG